MKKNFLLILMIAFIAKGNAASYDFPLSELGALWRHTTITVDYTAGNNYADVTFAPADFWAAQAGWLFAELDEELENPKNEPKDFSGNRALVCEFEAVNVTSGNVLFGILSASDGGYTEVAVSPEEGIATLDLGSFTDDQLASIANVCLLVTDEPTETATLRVKSVYLVEGEPERGDFLLSRLTPLWGHSTVKVDYEVGDEYATLTYDPVVFYAAQAGWSYANVLDFTGYTALVLEFENVITDNLEASVFAELTGNGVNFSEGISWADMSITIDLTQQPDDVLSQINMLSIMVTGNEGDDKEPVIVQLKKVYLESGDTSVKYLYEDEDNSLVDVYTIAGIKLYSQVDKKQIIQELPKGLYIIGNKKINILK